jgi:hypothetical protein
MQLFRGVIQKCIPNNHVFGVQLCDILVSLRAWADGSAKLRTTFEIQRYILSTSIDDSTPSLAKFFASHSPAHFRP